LVHPLRRTHRHPELTDEAPLAPARPEPGSLGVLPADGVVFEARLWNPLNAPFFSWRAQRARTKEQHRACGEALAPYVRPAPPWLVTLTWEHMNAADDDGISAAMKGVRDRVAEWLSVDDGDRELVHFEYAQALHRELVKVLLRGRWVRQAVSRVRVQVVTRS
jgi:hypothetical protein